MSLYPRLLGDVGGTNARFAWQAHARAPISHVQSLRGDDHAGLAEALEAYLQCQQLPRPQAVGIGIANPIEGDRVVMTNRDWSFSMRELAHQLGVAQLKVINDFTALALALPELRLQECVQVGGPSAPMKAHEPQPLALIGPGTGLGVGGLLPDGRGGWRAISGEGGHVTLAARTELEWRLLVRLRARWGHVSAERVLSGQGLSELHLALRQELEPGAEPQPLPAARITELALQHQDAISLQCLDLFAGFLGSVAGDLALTLGARGGVYLGGGIVPRWLGWFESSSFRASFEAKGRFATYLQAVPVWVIQAQESPALRGAALALDQEPA